ncbi:MAG: NAD-dependent epimerase/dehydratase family protein [Candidatus Dormibacteraceae bacterium]
MSELVLITGGAGFIGMHTSRALLEKGYAVRIFDWLRPPVHEAGTVPPWLSKDVDVMVGDVRDKDAMRKALRGAGSVMHLAAYQDYLPDFSTFFHTNTVGTALLYELIVEDKLPIRKAVVASSQAAYGEGSHRCQAHGLFQPDLRPDELLRAGRWEIPCPVCGEATEWVPANETAVNPQNQYAISKYTQELVSLNLGRRYSVPTTCMRYSITQGRWQSPRNAYSGICRIFTLRALAGKPAIVFEDGNQMRDYVYVGDVARANVLALEDPRTDYEVYNVGGDRAVSALDYALIVADRIGLDAPPEVPGYYRFGDTRHIVSDSSKLKALGWATTVGIEEVVDEYAAWAREESFADTSDAAIQRMLSLGTLRASGQPAAR